LSGLAGLDDIISIFDVSGEDSPSEPTQQLMGHGGYVSCVRFLNDNSVVTSSGDQTCAVWDIESARRVTSFVGYVTLLFIT
jgi:guanine nucleotide-binding protein G(I)/G(S)/G(T) subunit beta-1